MTFLLFEFLETENIDQLPTLNFVSGCMIDNYSSDSKYFFDITVAQCESQLETDCLKYDSLRKILNLEHGSL